MAQAPPSPLGAFQHTIFSAPFGLGQAVEHFFAYWYELAAGDTPEWRRFVYNIADLVSDELADDAKVSFDVVNFTGGSIDTSWTSSDYGGVTSRLNNIMTAWATHMDTHHQVNRVDAYRMTFAENWVGSPTTAKLHPFNLTGPPEHSAALSITGQGTFGPMAPQIAFSVTEIVPVRRSWGRFYLPFPDAGGIEPTSNRWKASLVDAVATSVYGEYSALGDQEFQVVVPITQSQKARVGALEQIVNIRTDDVPDVIRRRRYKHAQYKRTL